MDIENKPTLEEKQAFWAEQLPNFESKYWLPSHFEFVVFDMNQGNYVIKDGLDSDLEDDATEVYHRVNTGWAMWKKAINFSQEEAKAQAVPECINDIQAWIAKYSFSALDASIVDFPVVDANELAEFIDSLNIDVAVPEGFVLVHKAESTGLTDKNEKLIFVGDVVEFVGGCRDFLDLSGVGSPLYTVNKGDKMIVRKLKSGYTLSLPWIDCDTPNRIGNLGNYDFWNLHRDFVVIEAQEQK
jgi:hypothetical protein